MDAALEQRLAAILDADIARLSPLTGGCIAAVYRIDLASGDTLVAKLSRTGAGLAIEGWMLDYLRRHSDLLVPEVRHSDDALLVMTYLDADGRLDAAAEADAAGHLAALHGVTAPTYGLDRDTVIGGCRSRMHHRRTGDHSSPNNGCFTWLEPRGCKAACRRKCAHASNGWRRGWSGG